VRKHRRASVPPGPPSCQQPSLAHRLRYDERGWTLIELLLVCVLSIVVLGVPLTMSVQSVITQNRATSRSAATNRLEVGVARLLGDLRQSAHTTTVSGTTATMTLPIRTTAGGTPTTRQVTWTCTSGGSCTRKVGTATAIAVIPNVVSATFTASSATDPAYVSVTISVLDATEAGSSHTTAVPGVTNAITVTDGVALRNFAV
jgi:type II secretory pathway pseudopilin PulG